MTTIAEVVCSFLDRKSARAGNLRTDGDRLYSYGRPIAGFDQGSGVLVMVRAECLQTRMRTHRASLVRAMGWNAYTSIEVSHPRAIVPGYDYDREPSAVYVLWGSKLDHAGEQWVKLETFTKEAKERREREGWSTRVLVKGTRP